LEATVYNELCERLGIGVGVFIGVERVQLVDG
jgi:hypothetical protein